MVDAMLPAPVLVNEWFSLREGERIEAYQGTDDPPHGNWFMARLVPVAMPRGPRDETPRLQGGVKGSEQFAIVAAQMGEKGWKWLILSPATKEAIADLLFDGGLPLDQWHCVTVFRED